jgi:PAS domain S-box-containing protein
MIEQKLKILVIEDNEDDLFFIRKALDRSKYDIREISDGKEAFEYLLSPEEAPDIVLLDYHLPGMNGLEILEKILDRQMDYGIIFLTIDNTVETIRKAMKTGAIDFLPKDYDLKNELPEVIEKVYRIYRNKKEKKEYAETIRENEERYRSLFELSPEAIIILDSDGKINACNDSFYRVTHLTEAETIGRNFGDLNVFEAEEVKRLKNKFTRLVAGEKLRPIDFSWIRKDGQLRHGIFHVGCIERAGNIEIQAIVRDATEEVNFKRILKESEEKLRSTISSVEDLIFVLDKNGVFIEFYAPNPKIMLLPPDEFLGKHYMEVGVPHELLDMINTCITKLIDRNEVQQVDYTLDLGGEIKWFNAKFNQRFDINDNFDGVTCLVRDITARKKSEEDMQKISKLESLGTLAGGIAHNFKNLLATISFNLDFVKMNPDASGNYIRNVERALNQANALASRFQTFSSGGDPVKESTNIHQLIDEAVSISLSGSNVNERIKIPQDIWFVNIDSVQMSEALVNILINAKQSMPRGGTVHLEARNFLNTQTDEKIDLNPGKYVQLTIRDEGIGIPEDIRNNIFDPFFTTKPEGHGLGLSTVHFIIKKHDGKIELESDPGIGTTFKIYLPISEEQPKAEERKEIDLIQGTNDKILFMDDDQDMRENIKELGELLDYHFVCVKDGYEAIEYYMKAYEKGEPYQAVILDLTIKGSDMGGEEVIKKLRVLDPEVKAIVFSGHSTKPIVANYRDYGFSGKLNKPVNTAEFLSVLNKVLES